MYSIKYDVNTIGLLYRSWQSLRPHIQKELIDAALMQDQLDKFKAIYEKISGTRNVRRRDFINMMEPYFKKYGPLFIKAFYLQFGKLPT